MSSAMNDLGRSEIGELKKPNVADERPSPSPELEPHGVEVNLELDSRDGLSGIWAGGHHQ